MWPWYLTLADDLYLDTKERVLQQGIHIWNRFHLPFMCYGSCQWSFFFADKQKNRQTEQKLYAPDISIRGHKNRIAKTSPVRLLHILKILIPFKEWRDFFCFIEVPNRTVWNREYNSNCIYFLYFMLEFLKPLPLIFRNIYYITISRNFQHWDLMTSPLMTSPLLKICLQKGWRPGSFFNA